MSIKEIELAVTQLTPEELSQFTAWFEEFQAGRKREAQEGPQEGQTFIFQLLVVK